MNKFCTIFVALILAHAAWGTNSNNPSKCHKPVPVKPVKQCKTKPPKPTPPPTPKPVPVTSTSSSNSASTSISAANSASNSASSAAIKDSGNSSSNSSSTATGGNASADGNGNGSNNSSTTFAAPKIPVSTAYAPEILPTAPCVKGNSGGAQTAPFGISLGLSKVDEGCDIRQEALTYLASGSRLSYCKIMVTSKRSIKAGITLADCMNVPTVPTVPVPDAPVSISREEIAPTAQPVIVALPPPSPVLLADCDLIGSRIDNTCKALLDSAILYFKEADGGFLRINADAFYGTRRVANIAEYLTAAGVNKESIKSSLDAGHNHGAQVTFVQE